MLYRAEEGDLDQNCLSSVRWPLEDISDSAGQAQRDSSADVGMWKC